MLDLIFNSLSQYGQVFICTHSYSTDHLSLLALSSLAALRTLFKNSASLACLLSLNSSLAPLVSCVHADVVPCCCVSILLTAAWLLILKHSSLLVAALVDFALFLFFISLSLLFPFLDCPTLPLSELLSGGSVVVLVSLAGREDRMLGSTDSLWRRKRERDGERTFTSENSLLWFVLLMYMHDKHTCIHMACETKEFVQCVCTIDEYAHVQAHAHVHVCYMYLTCLVLVQRIQRRCTQEEMS